MESCRLLEQERLQMAANDFAAALLPSKPFMTLMYSYPGVTEGNAGALQKVAQRVKVSRETIPRRLVTLRKVSKKVYTQKRATWKNTPWHPPRGGRGGPPMEVRVVSRNGHNYIRWVLSAYDQALISSSAASDYLRVKPKHFDKIRRVLFSPG